MAAKQRPDYACDYPTQQTHCINGNPRKNPSKVVECSVCQARILDGSLKCYHTMNRVFCERCARSI